MRPLCASYTHKQTGLAVIRRLYALQAAVLRLFCARNTHWEIHSMKTRQQIYGQEAASILRDVSMYRTLTREQLLRLYPGKQDKVDKLLAHLVRQGRIFHDKAAGLYCAGEDAATDIDRGLLASVWVLVDLIGQVEYHPACDFPGKIMFFADGEVYEIVPIAAGQEAMVSQLLAGSPKDPPKYIVLVDRPEQIAGLLIPNVSGYCTVSDDGAVQYYQKE